MVICAAAYGGNKSPGVVVLGLAGDYCRQNDFAVYIGGFTMNIDLSRFKVVYGDKVLNAVALTDYLFGEKGYPNPDSECVIHKLKFITILAINEDGNIIAICDEAWRFQFIPIVTKGD